MLPVSYPTFFRQLYSYYFNIFIAFSYNYQINGTIKLYFVSAFSKNVDNYK